MKEVTPQATTKLSKDQYMCIVDKTGNVVAFVNPANHIAPDALVKSLASKGVSAEIRVRSEVVQEIEL